MRISAKSLITSILTIILGTVSATAQIGYQVAIVDPSTGKPKNNETLSVTVTLSDNTGTIIFSDTQSATTNEFGVVSLQVGNSDTFSNVDWSKLPLWVSASVGDVIIGKTQVLNVPVAEHAKHYGELTKEILTSKSWGDGIYRTYHFSSTGTAILDLENESISRYSYIYYIVGNTLVLRDDYYRTCETLTYIPEANALAGDYIFK